MLISFVPGRLVGCPNSGHLGRQEHEHPAADQGHQTSGTASSHQGSETVILNRQILTNLNFSLPVECLSEHLFDCILYQLPV